MLLISEISFTESYTSFVLKIIGNLCIIGMHVVLLESSHPLLFGPAHSICRCEYVQAVNTCKVRCTGCWNSNNELLAWRLHYGECIMLDIKPFSWKIKSVIYERMIVPLWQSLLCAIKIVYSKQQEITGIKKSRNGLIQCKFIVLLTQFNT